MSKSSSEQKPTQVPPADSQSKKATSTEATPLQNISVASGAGAAAVSSPNKNLPGNVNSGAAGEAAGTTWNNAANINALWSVNQDKNSWVGIAGVSWIKLSTASDSGIVALTMLGSHAKQMGSTVYYRQEDDGMIHEFYVW